MSFETVIVLGLLAYALLFFGLGRLFPKDMVQVVRASECSHQVRRPYEPESSLGDESDYRSRCAGCGCVLRWEPNA